MKALQFNGRGAEYFRIWIVNVLLTIVTFGLYYPWAKVRSARYFAGNTELEGRSFEYHATGRQLFVGFIISIVLLVIFVVLQNLNPIAGGVMLIIGLLMFPWVVWRSVQFNMRMTSFSNVRFGFDGTLGGSYFAYLLLPLTAYLVFALAVITAFSVTRHLVSAMAQWAIIPAIILAVSLGVFLYAFLKKRQTGYLINGYRFGQGQFRTDIATGKFAGIILKTYGLGLLLMVLALITVGVFAMLTGLLGELSVLQDILADQNPEAIQNLLAGGAWILIPVLYLLLILLSLIVIAYGYTRNRRYIMGNSLLDNKVGFASTLSARAYSWIMITNLLLVILTVGLGIPWARVRMARLIAGNTQVDTRQGFDEYMSQKQKEQSSLGEQIGDAFDVDVGMGF